MIKALPPALFYTLVVSLGGFIFGFDASVISGAVGFIVDDFHLSGWEQGFVVSSPTLGGLLALALLAPSAMPSVGANLDCNCRIVFSVGAGFGLC